MLGELAAQHARDHRVDALEHAVGIGHVVFADGGALSRRDGVDFAQRSGLGAGAFPDGLLRPGAAIDVGVPRDVEIVAVSVEVHEGERAPEAHDRLLPFLFAVDAPIPDALVGDRPVRIGVRLELA